MMHGAKPTPNEAVAGKTSILIADDDFLISDCLRLALEKTGRYRVDVVGNFDATIAAPDEYRLILLDVNMPGMGGVASVRQAVEHFASGAVILFSGNVSAEFLRASLSFGARGLIPKDIEFRLLEKVFELLLLGQRYVPYEYLTDTVGESAPVGALTPKETEILIGVANGKRNKAIAHDLGTTEVAIKMHLRSIFAKLHVENRTRAVMLARERNII